MGEHTLSTPIDCWTKNECAPKPQDFVPTKIIPHESYNAPNPFQHDIALLKLDRPVVRNGTAISANNTIVGFSNILRIIFETSWKCL